MRMAFLLICAALCGCNTEEPTYLVHGKVTFQAAPVTEGTVQFMDETTGRGAEVDLQSDGGYQATLHAGAYQVAVLPPYLVDNSSGIPNPKYKAVKNIPDKYHSSATSGLAAEISADKTTHDFALMP